MKSSPLRFAAFSRVSTEMQAERGRSLRTQRRQIEDSVAKAGGEIAEWFGGTHEHGTAGWERKEFDRLLQAAQMGGFDAVIVSDLSRWSRDNRRSKEGLEILRRRRIRFFAHGQEYDLNDPHAQFMLGVSGEVNELYAKRFAQLTHQNRVEGARRGEPTAGTLPWGRNYDAEKGIWTADPECKALARKWFKQYMAGRTFARIADEDGSEENTIRRRLLRAGPTLRQSFRYQGKTEVVECGFPGLLTSEEVERVRKKAQENRLIRTTPTSYPLAHLVRCAKCGSVFSGHNITSGNHKIRHYRHHNKTKREGCTNYVPADLLEQDVFFVLGRVFRRSEGLLEGVKAALAGDEGSRSEALSDLNNVVAAIAKVRREQANLIEYVRTAGVSGDTLERVKERTSKIEERLEGLLAQKSHLEAKVQFHDQAGELKKTLDEAVRAFTHWHGGIVVHWPDSAKRRLAHFLFGRKRRNVSGHGVYVALNQSSDGECYWTWEAKGIFGVEKGATTNIVSLNDYHSDSESQGFPVDVETLRDLVAMTKTVKLAPTRARW